MQTEIVPLIWRENDKWVMLVEQLGGGGLSEHKLCRGISGLLTCQCTMLDFCGITSEQITILASMLTSTCIAARAVNFILVREVRYCPCQHPHVCI